MVVSAKMHVAKVLCILSILFATETNAAAIKETKTSSSECNVDCSHAKDKTVCASDGQTYRHKCELRRIRVCEGRKVRAVSMGTCQQQDNQESRKESLCEEKRRQVLSQNGAITPQSGNDDAMTTSHVPSCTPDGAFTDVQCHLATGYCWCVTPEGNPIPGTSRLLMSASGGRESQFDVTMNCAGDSVTEEGSGCSRQDRVIFNENLWKLLNADYQRNESGNEAASR